MRKPTGHDHQRAKVGIVVWAGTPPEGAPGRRPMAPGEAAQAPRQDVAYPSWTFGDTMQARSRLSVGKSAGGGEAIVAEILKCLPFLAVVWVHTAFIHRFLAQVVEGGHPVVAHYNIDVSGEVLWCERIARPPRHIAP